MYLTVSKRGTELKTEQLLRIYKAVKVVKDPYPPARKYYNAATYG